MFLSYIRIAWRILLNNKSYSLINITGLGLGFSVSMLLMIYVAHQLSFDRFHENSKNIYRLSIEGYMADGQYISAALTSGQIGSLLGDRVPGTEKAVRTYVSGDQEIFIDQQRFAGERVTWVDEGFFEMFSFGLIIGDPGTVIKEPYTVVLSERAAEKYFGNSDVVDKTIRIGNRDYRVSGLMENMPVNSHIQYDVLASFSSVEGPDYNIVEEQGLSFPTYVMIANGMCHKEYAVNAFAVADEYLNELFNPLGLELNHDLQPLERIYLHSGFSIGIEEAGDIRNVYIFSLLTLFILLIAVFNFVNLMTAQSEKRAREIGLRKVVGAGKKDLMMQFIGESVLVSLLAFVFALCMNEILIGIFSDMLNENFRLVYWYMPDVFAVVILFVLAVGVIAGAYPAFYLAGYQPAVVLKGEYQGRGRPNRFRKVLVSLQFGISIFLIASLLLVREQVMYMKHRDLGFQREHVITVRNLTGIIYNSYEGLKAELLQNPGIISVTASASIPGQSRSVQNAYKRGQDPSTAILIHENRVQHDYIETFGMRIIEGRDFDPELRTDTAAIIINEMAARKLGLDQPVGEEIHVLSHAGPVIGVVSDFNFRSLHHEIDPMAFTMYTPGFRQISIRFDTDDTREVTDYIKNIFENADPNYVFDYIYVDQLFEMMYQQEERINQMIKSAAVLAIIISFMGLFALTSFTVNRKVKEIGVRKTFGAPVRLIVWTLMEDMARWLIAGAVVAVPLSWFVVSSWLENFAFRIDIWANWFLFIFALILASTVALIAMLYQSLTAARANPALSLRAE